MAIRLPQGRSRLSASEASLGALEAELFNEKMESLGHAGRLAQEALAALDAFSGERGGEVHEALLDHAAARVWAFVVQREICGFRDTAAIIADLAVPREVTARLGVAAHANLRNLR